MWKSLLTFTVAALLATPVFAQAEGTGTGAQPRAAVAPSAPVSAPAPPPASSSETERYPCCQQIPPAGSIEVKDGYSAWSVIYNGRGIAYAGQRDYTRAIADYSEAIRLGRDTHLECYYTNRGKAYAGQRDYARAVADYSEAIRLQPNRGRFTAPRYANRGDVYYSQSDFAHAVADYSEAIRLLRAIGDATSYYRSRAEAYRRQGDEVRATADLDQWERLMASPTRRQTPSDGCGPFLAR